MNTWQDIFKVWGDGGWVMVPLAAVGVLMYSIALQLLLYFSRRDYRRIPREVWAEWVKDPGQGQGEVGEIIRYTQDEVDSLDAIQNRFAEVQAAKLPRINMRLDVLHKLITAAPLLGLLGTVLGMIDTFGALHRGGGNVVDLISSGIAKALITTETGLLLALPGYFLAYRIRSRRNQYQAFLAELESATMHWYQRKQQENP
jgi:biopolymer transport protein ExbB